MHVPLVDLKAQYESIRDEVDAAVARVMASGRYVMGEEVEAFEREWAAFCGARYCVGVGSGTEALYLALLACYQPRSLITTPLTFFATTQAILAAGHRPYFDDVQPHGNIEIPTPRRRIVDRHDTQSIYLPVDLYGRPVEHVGEQDIVDSAQAHGVPHRGLAACWSFYPTKNLGAAGQAGAVTTDDDGLAQELRRMRTYGEGEERFVMEGPHLTGNHRLDALQAAILRAKLPHLREWNARRRTIAALYQRGLAGLPGLVLPEDHPQHVYHAYVVQHERRDELRAWLRQHEVETQVRFPVLMSDQPVLQARIGPLSSLARFPNAFTIARCNLNLPIYPEMTDEQVEDVVGLVQLWAKRAP